METESPPTDHRLGRNSGTSAEAICRVLLLDGFTKYAASNTSSGGFVCKDWGDDSEGGRMVRIEFWRPGRGLKGATSEETQNRVRRENLVRMRDHLIGVGYQVCWGWDKKNGEPDTTFMVAAIHAPRLAPEDETQPGKQIAPVEPEEKPVLQGPVVKSGLLITIPEIEKAVQDITSAHDSGNANVARTLEHALYRQVLLAIVVGNGAHPRMLAAAALATQHLAIPR